MSEHLINFFYLYGVLFDYKTLGISIRGKLGHYIERNKCPFDNTAKMEIPNLLCFENPQDPSIDLGKGVYNYPTIQRVFENTYEQLKFNSSFCTSILGAVLPDYKMKVSRAEMVAHKMI